MSNPTVLKIVTDYLKANGYDGLYTDECGCLLGDLCPRCPCSDDAWECQAGYKVPCDCDTLGEPCEWHIGPDKPPKKSGE